MCVLIAAVAYGAPDPDATLRSALALHDLGHVAAFGLVAMLLARALPARSRPPVQARRAAIWIAAGAALALGAAVELAQAVSGRGGDPWDVARDGGGALCAALMLTARESAISSGARAALAAAAFSVAAALTYPVVVALIDEGRARTQFPILASFETRSELSRFQFGDGVIPRIVPIIDDEGRAASALRLQLPPGRYPGFELRHFPGDWRGMRALRLLIVNLGRVPIEMTVRIDDIWYDYRLDAADRYNRAFSLSPGANRIEIPLSEVAAGPRGRRFDLARARSLLVYAVDLEQAREITIGPISLLP
jgi:hypothetical protein